MLSSNMGYVRYHGQHVWRIDHDAFDGYLVSLVLRSRKTRPHDEVGDRHEHKHKEGDRPSAPWEASGTAEEPVEHNRHHDATYGRA